MKCCPHIEVLYKRKTSSAGGGQQEAATAAINLDHVEKLFRRVIELRRGGGGDAATTLKCASCEQRTGRLHMCAHCFEVACTHHAEQHARSRAHPVSVEIAYASVYCHVCRDVQYNRVLDEFVRELFLKENFFPFGTSPLYLHFTSISLYKCVHMYTYILVYHFHNQFQTIFF